MKRIALAFAVALLAGTGAQAHVGGSDGVNRIDIVSQWGGLGTPRQTVLQIRRTAQGYRLNDAPVPDKAVTDLLDALRQGAQMQPDLANLGFDRAWLAAHSVPTEIDSRLNGKSPSQLALYKRWFTDPAIIGKILVKIYSPESFHTDDYPRLTLTVTLENGTTIVAESVSQQPFMLPWSVTVRGDETVTYNAHIARAIAALLPPDATNAGRVSGAGFDAALEENVMVAIEGDWNRLDAESRAPAALALLRGRYEIRSAEIDDGNGVLSLVSGAAGTNFEARLSRAAFPGGLTVALELPFRGGAVEGADAFMKSGVAYEDLVLSVKWLGAFLRGHREIPVHLAYIRDASLSADAMAAFTADMHGIAKDDLAAEIAPMRARAALLIVDDMYAEAAWIVLPDRRMVLWHYRSEAGLLKWKPGDFVTKACAETDTFDDGGCVGAVISPDGAIVE